MLIGGTAFPVFVLAFWLRLSGRYNRRYKLNP